MSHQPATRLLLAVDCGSTNLKAAVLDRQLRCRGSASVAVSYSLADGTRFEMPVAPLKDAFFRVCEDACEAGQVSSREIDVVVFGSQAQTFAWIDACGHPLSPFYSWMDKRAVAESEELQERLGHDFHQHCSFGACMPQLQLAKVLWCRRHLGDSLAAKETRIVSLPGYFSLLLGSGQVMDRNLAAMGGLYSLQRQTWWDEALACCELKRSDLGRLVDVGEAVSMEKTAPNQGFRPDLRIVHAGNDQTVGAYGNGCRRGGMVVTLGTALVVYRYAGEKPGPFHPGGCWGPYPGGGYYELATRDEGCQALDWAMPMVFANATPRECDQAAAEVWENGSLEQAPLFFPQYIRTEKTWKGDGSAAQRAYAVLEGIAFSLTELIEEQLQITEKPDIISVVGGGSRSSIWLTILAHALGCTVVRGHGDALSGAAAMALAENVNPLVQEDETWQPAAPREALLRKRYNLWLAQR